jgi:hypothetical protein
MYITVYTQRYLTVKTAACFGCTSVATKMLYVLSKNVYIRLSVTHNTLLWSFIAWQLVSSSSVGYHHPIAQEHESEQKLSTVR